MAASGLSTSVPASSHRWQATDPAAPVLSDLVFMIAAADPLGGWCDYVDAWLRWRRSGTESRGSGGDTLMAGFAAISRQLEATKTQVVVALN